MARELGRAFIIDSSKNLEWTWDSNKWARLDGLKVFNLLLWKNPVAFAHSFWKRRGSLALALDAFCNYYGRFFESKLPFLAVSYENLVREPANVIATICDRIGMDYQVGQERFWEGRHHHLFGNIDTRLQIGAPLSAIKFDSFEDEFSELMPELESMIDERPIIQAYVDTLECHDVAKTEAPVIIKRLPRGVK